MHTTPQSQPQFLFDRLCGLVGAPPGEDPAESERLRLQLFREWLALQLVEQRRAIEQVLSADPVERAEQLERIYELGGGALIPPGASDRERQLFWRNFEMNIGFILAESTFRTQFDTFGSR